MNSGAKGKGKDAKIRRKKKETGAVASKQKSGKLLHSRLVHARNPAR
jgi:hypothetical protein